MPRAGVLCLALLAACGDDVNDAPPRLIPGGGVGDGSVGGTLHVYVIDDATGDPIGSAEVYVGEPDTQLATGTTDSSGLFSLTEEGLSGRQTITAVADGYTAETWFGVDGANVTIPLQTASPEVGQAQLSGSIDGWDDLPTPETNHYFLALVLYSFLPDFGAPENDITTPTVGMLPRNACGKGALGSQCAWVLNTRTGRVALFAAVVDGDSKGNTMFEDDTFEVVGYAIKRGLTVEDGVDQSGITLDMVPPEDLASMSLQMAEPPAGLSNLFGAVAVDVGDEGILFLAAPGTVLQEESGEIVVPALDGALAGATYWAVARATSAAAGELPSTTVVRRGLTALTVDFGDWLPTPSDLTASAGRYSFTAAPGAALHAGAFHATGGRRAWGYGLFDGRTSFTLPGITPDPLPAGEVVLRVGALDLEIDLSDFSIEDLGGEFDRAADNETTFTH